jgi:hypothetical protein
MTILTRGQIKCCEQLTATCRIKIEYPMGVPLNWKYGALAEGLCCYRNAEFFQAHEHWEKVWLLAEEPEKRFLQALIQVTVAFHHYQAGNLLGALSLLQRAERKFKLYPASFGGIAVAALCADIHQCRLALEGDARSIPLVSPNIKLMDQDLP